MGKNRQRGSQGKNSENWKERLETVLETTGKVVVLAGSVLTTVNQYKQMKGNNTK